MGKAGSVVYYVEDDKNIRELTVYALGQGGIEARGCADDAEFRRACAERTPDAVLLDIMLPDTDGLQILARLRRTPGLSHVPVMMLTAKDTELDAVRALDSGADDYLSKPFGPRAGGAGGARRALDWRRHPLARPSRGGGRRPGGPAHHARVRPA